MSLNLYDKLRVIDQREGKALTYTGCGRQDGQGLSTDSDARGDRSEKERLGETQLYKSEEDDWEQGL